jgi:hypothetical protein
MLKVSLEPFRWKCKVKDVQKGIHATSKGKKGKKGALKQAIRNSPRNLLRRVF